MLFQGSQSRNQSPHGSSRITSTDPPAVIYNYTVWHKYIFRGDLTLECSNTFSIIYLQSLILLSNNAILSYKSSSLIFIIVHIKIHTIILEMFQIKTG